MKGRADSAYGAVTLTARLGSGMLLFVRNFDVCAAMINCNLDIVVSQIAALTKIEKKICFIYYDIGDPRYL